AIKPSLSHDHVTAIHQDGAGNLWIGTWGGGLNRLDKAGTFTTYRASQGLASDVGYGILEDKAGALWLTTNDGLSKLEPGTGSMISFRSGDGLMGDEFGQAAYYRGPSGRFYIGGPHGFNMFVPEQIKPDAYVPPIVLTKLEVLGESRPVPEK